MNSLSFFFLTSGILLVIFIAYVLIFDKGEIDHDEEAEDIQRRIDKLEEEMRQ